MESHFRQLNERENIRASEFELLAATAFQIFNDEKVEVGVVEVGMGGRLDATNILNNQAVSVISKIAHDHQNFLGNTIEEITHHKAGILRPGVPYIVNPFNEPNVHDTIAKYAEEIGAGPSISVDTPQLRSHLYASVYWQKFAGPLEPFRRHNAILAYLAVVETMQTMGLFTSKLRQMLPGIKNKVFPGRFQMLTIHAVFGPHNKQILLDGAHNVDAAVALNHHVTRKLRFPQKKDLPVGGRVPLRVTWVIAMSDGKDASNFLNRLLHPGDSLITTTFTPVDGMPWVKPMNPNELLQIAKRACPGITGLAVPEDGIFRALCAAKYLTDHYAPIVVTGSLYLAGDLLRERAKWIEEGFSPERGKIDMEEQNRVNTFVSSRLEDLGRGADGHVQKMTALDPIERKALSLKQEIENLDWQLSRLEEEEKSLDGIGFPASREVERDLQALKDSTFQPASDSERPALREKFFADFEDIRKQLQKLPDTSRTTEHSALQPQDGPKDVEPRPEYAHDLTQKSPRFRIYRHLARDSQEGTTPIRRISRSPNLGSRPRKYPSHIRRVISQDQIEIKIEKVKAKAPYRILKHYSKP